MEATFANVGVYLDRPEWQQALQSTIIPETRFGDRSEPAVSLWMITAVAPGLFHRATDIIMHRSPRPEEPVVHSLHKLLLNYSIWIAKWGDRFTDDTHAMHSRLSDGVSAFEWTDIFATYLLYLALMHRFLSALQPHTLMFTEQAAVAASLRVVKLAEYFQPSGILPLRVGLALRVAGSIQHTTRQWSESRLLYPPAPSRTINPEIFSNWCVLLHRSTGEPMSCMELG